MNESDMRNLAQQLDIPMPAQCIEQALYDALKAKGLEVGLDMTNGDWVVIDGQRNVVARVD